MKMANKIIMTVLITILIFVVIIFLYYKIVNYQNVKKISEEAERRLQQMLGDLQNGNSLNNEENQGTIPKAGCDNYEIQIINTKHYGDLDAVYEITNKVVLHYKENLTQTYKVKQRYNWGVGMWSTEWERID